VIFFQKDGRVHHVGIVASADGERVHTIEGNTYTRVHRIDGELPPTAVTGEDGEGRYHLQEDEGLFARDYAADAGRIHGYGRAD